MDSLHGEFSGSTTAFELLISEAFPRRGSREARLGAAELRAAERGLIETSEHRGPAVRLKNGSGVSLIYFSARYLIRDGAQSADIA